MAALCSGAADYVERLAVRFGARLERILVLHCAAAHANPWQPFPGKGTRRLASELYVGIIGNGGIAHRGRVRACILLSQRRDAADAACLACGGCRLVAIDIIGTRLLAAVREKEAIE